MNSPPIKVQAGLGRDPFGGELFCFRGRKADQVKILWHDGVGMSLYMKRLEAGKFIWPTPGAGEALAISAAQLGYLLAGIDWRNPRWTRAAVKDGIIARKHLPEAARPPVSQMIAFIEESREALGGSEGPEIDPGDQFPRWTPICRALQFAPSTYYERRAIARDPERGSARAKSDAALSLKIDGAWADNRKLYGARKIWHVLRREGEDAARCTVER